MRHANPLLRALAYGEKSAFIQCYSNNIETPMDAWPIPSLGRDPTQRKEAAKAWKINFAQGVTAAIRVSGPEFPQVI